MSVLWNVQRDAGFSSADLVSIIDCCFLVSAPWNLWCDTGLMYQSIPNLTILSPGLPPGIHMFPHPGAVQGFELEKFSTVLKEKCRNFSICFKETEGSLKSRCCAVSYQFLQNCRCLLFEKIDSFRLFPQNFKVIQLPRVIFAYAELSLKVACLRSLGLSSTFGLFSYSLGYSGSIKKLLKSRKTWFEFFSSYYLLKVVLYLLVTNFLCWLM